MKKKEAETTVVSQYCLDVVPTIGFIEKLPKKIRIVTLAFRGTFRTGRRKLNIPEYLKRVGVNTASETASQFEVRGVFKNNMQRDTMISTLKQTSRTYKIPTEKFMIERLVLSDEKPTCTVSFRRMYKQIRLPNDKRRKKLVLGMVIGEGKNYHDNILAVLSAKKISCTLAKTERTIVLCSEEVVVRGRK